MIRTPIIRIAARMRPLASLPSPRHRTIHPRFSSTTTTTTRPEGSFNHKTFYKTFSRPILKVFLMAIFTYQVAYYFWVRLEQNETRAEMKGEFLARLRGIPES
ncbi:hypothetical protein GGS20DRAFT_581743 [Poronia punctata]|nr:hypothetical protein GGS20DRAFT_581743 [Poronia punctata]